MTTTNELQWDTYFCDGLSIRDHESHDYEIRQVYESDEYQLNYNGYFQSIHDTLKDAKESANFHNKHL